MNPGIQTQKIDFQVLAIEARQLAEAAANPAGGRAILGITGPPGAGKSTIARALCKELADVAVLISMDGFHLANSVLDAAGSRSRKGAPDTFDVHGFVNLLARLHRQAEEVVYAPEFDRSLDESIGSAVPVPRNIPLVIVEGNYLLHQEAGWGQVGGFLSECWFMAPPDEQRMRQLITRHESYGRSPQDAAGWALGPDQASAEIVERTRRHASRIIHVPSIPGTTTP